MLIWRELMGSKPWIPTQANLPHSGSRTIIWVLSRSNPSSPFSIVLASEWKNVQGSGAGSAHKWRVCKASFRKGPWLPFLSRNGSEPSVPSISLLHELAPCSQDTSTDLAAGSYFNMGWGNVTWSRASLFRILVRVFSLDHHCWWSQEGDTSWALWIVSWFPVHRLGPPGSSPHLTGLCFPLSVNKGWELTSFSIRRGVKTPKDV